ncbi:hypothetical protein ABE562_04900 [Brucella intermedia]|uniref:Uncharacterized protein n=1 Tax=Brucella intermedia GD04153 TaxID=2975438 RepID=A0AA42GXC2_9HYPH|nr:hypothetical protein [Brucella intermedia]MDH0123304.1 hypothetical protein [Brucella intermedia GD04153]
MAHVKRQIRDGVKGVLKALPDLASVHSESRTFRAAQRNEFPMAIVSVAENVELADKNPVGNRIVQRNMNIAVTLAIRDTNDDAEDILDDLSVAVEKALLMPSSVNAGKLMFWRFNGSGAMSGEPTEDGIILVQPLNFSCSVMTKDAEPDINLHQ